MGIQSLAEDSITVCSKTPTVIENIYHKLQNFCNRKCSCVIELSSSVFETVIKGSHESTDIRRYKDSR